MIERPPKNFERMRAYVPRLRVLLGGLLMLCGASQVVGAKAVPDLTQGEKPTESTVEKGNLGPTGMLGWVHHSRNGKAGKSRQILVTEVLEDSPAEGVMAVGDVILGADGSGGEPVPFASNALRRFADAITAAEARKPAALNLLVWRDGKTETRTITLDYMGAYSPTAPYGCQKSARILRNAMAYLDKADPDRDRFGFNTLALIACNSEALPGNAERMAKAREQIIEILPNQKYYDLMVGDQIETSSKVAWNRTYALIVLAEYYLATGDNPSNDTCDLVGAIDAYAQTISRGQSMFGTMGHQFSIQGEDGSVHGPYGVGYGPINATGLAALYGLTLARDCNLPNPETNAAIQAGIRRAANFFASYAFEGAIPYGEHPAWTKGHATNGRSGLAALALARVPGKERESRYFSKLSIAAAPERHTSGHGGSFFNYLWSPLGANVGGIEAAAAHFKDIRWHLELSRMHDGSFYYNDYTNHWYHGTRVFRKASLHMITPAILAYATPLKRLVMTGSQRKPATRLDASDVAEARFAGNYRPDKRTAEQLIDDLANFSVTVREQAATRLAERPDAERWLPRLHKIAGDPKLRGHHGVFRVLQKIGDPGSAPVLIECFASDDPFVRKAAALAFRGMPESVQVAQLDKLLKMTAALRRPPFKVDPDDPMNRELVALADLVFGKKGILAEGIEPVEQYSSREHLYAAIRAAATIPAGGRRGKLNPVLRQLPKRDVIALADTLLELAYVEAPADAMFANGVRCVAVEVLLKHGIAEGVPASLEVMKTGGRWARVLMLREWAKYGRSVLAVDREGITEAVKNYGDKKFAKEKKKVLAAFNDENKPPVTFTPLKEIRNGKADNDAP